ncbi:MAG: PTS sugar transporter subunit IIA [Sphingomonadaceae bacterium]|nr:PTS sugar transporter subunit IIA [Sphingomonadaceae bacterium]
MNAHFTLLPEAVRAADTGSKRAILEQLADLFSTIYGIDRDSVLDRMSAREKVGSTGFGRGVAIPHARLPGIKRPVAAFLRLSAPVDFDAADGGPVDLVFGLISPEEAGAAHLHALAAISRMMRDDRMHAGLASAVRDDELYGILCNVIDRDAA